jgi:hypothetical protein
VGRGRYAREGGLPPHRGWFADVGTHVKHVVGDAACPVVSVCECTVVLHCKTDAAARIVEVLAGPRACNTGPHPVKLVGMLVDIQFDISKVSLKAKVRITPGDALQTDTVTNGEGEGLDKDEGDESGLPTEIFIPLVHFASDGCVERSVAVWDHEQDLGDSEEVPEAGSGSGSTVTLPLTTLKLLVASEGETIETEWYAVLVKVLEGMVEMDESEQMLQGFMQSL